MTKAELIKAMAEKAEIKKTQATEALIALSDIIGEVLARGDGVNIPYLGTFYAEKIGGKEYKVYLKGKKKSKARYSPCFAPAQSLWRKVRSAEVKEEGGQEDGEV